MTTSIRKNTTIPQNIMFVTIAALTTLPSTLSGPILSPSNITTTSLLPSSSPTMVGLIFISSDSFLNFCSKSDVTRSVVQRLHHLLLDWGVPKTSLPTADDLCLSLFATVITLLLYFFLFGGRHVRKRKELTEELRLAQLQVHYLEEKLIQSTAKNLSNTKSGPIRIFMDGAFDMMHYGHMNAFRLGKSLGTHLIVGVNSDSSITKCKGAPLMNDQERLTMVQGCKFVDEVVPGCPYVMNEKYLDYVIKTLKVDYVIHGDDPCIVDGSDVYAAAKAMGKYQSIPRTEGVSTTDIVGRMLVMTKDHHYREEDEKGSDCQSRAKRAREQGLVLGQKSKFLTTSRMLRLFSEGIKEPEAGQRVIYMDGAWDMFHCGHMAILKEAKKRGDYLIVGVHGDAVVNEHRGSNLPLMNLHERVLSVLGSRYVDDVLIDAPYIITPDMLNSLRISEVVHGSQSDNMTSESTDYSERYRVAQQKGIFSIIESPCDFHLTNIMERIQKNQEMFQAKFERKMKQEQDHFDNKYGSGEVDQPDSSLRN